MKVSRKSAITLVLLLLGTLLCGLFTYKQWFGAPKEAITSDEKDPLLDSPNGTKVGTVESSRSDLGPSFAIRVNRDKRIAAGVEIGKVTVGPWMDSVYLPAKLELDPDRHFAITAPVDVIVEDLLIPLGSPVEASSPLLRLSAPEITQLRGQLETGKAQLRMVQSALDWYLSAQKNVEQLRSLVENSATLDIDSLPSETKVMGKYGGDILESIARFRAARRIWQSNSISNRNGAIPEKIQTERESEYEVGRANLASAIQQATFDLSQEVLKAKIEVERASNALQVTDAEMLHLQGARSSLKSDSESPLTGDEASLDNADTYTFRSPRAGTLVERYFARGERAATGETLVLIADLTKLWVVGELRSQHWDMLATLPTTPLSLEVTGLESASRRKLELVYVGGSVDAQSGAIRIAASADNSDGLLRPGMFAKLIVDRVDAPHTTIVPSSAVFQQVNQAFLLIEKSDEEFLLTPVKTGRSNDTHTEILSTIPADSSIVLRGVFAIASESLLESEE